VPRSDTSSPAACDGGQCMHGEHCGDGKLDEGEECDLGADRNADDARCGVQCTLVRCGDGIVQKLRGEQCDDLDDVDDNACNNDCHVPGSALWQASAPNVLIEALEVSATGAIAVGGFVVTASASGWEQWVNNYAANGKAAWPRAQLLDVGDSESAQALGFTSNGDIVALGGSMRTQQQTNSHMLLMRYARSTGDKLWTMPKSAVMGTTQTARDLAIGADDSVFVLGT